MKGKILIIDDEEGIRISFQSFLSEEGYDVITKEDYDSAMKAIAKNQIDLIFAKTHEYIFIYSLF